MTPSSRDVAVRLPLLAALLGALAGLLVLAGCADGGSGRAAATLVAGDTAEVARDGGWAPVAVGDILPEGARLRTGESEARLRLADGEVRLAPGSTAFTHRDVLELVGGAALVEAPGGPVVRWGDVEVAGTATYRLDAGVMPRAGVYDGEVVVRRLAEAARVPARRELALASQRLAREPVPLQYRDDDAWDRRWLARALQFDEEIGRLARGLDRDYGTDLQDADFYESFVAVEPATVPVLASTSRVTNGSRFGPPSDALVTLFVARAIADVRGADLAEAARDVAALRAAGARWGLIALEAGVGTRELARIVDLARERHVAAAPEEPEAGAGEAVEAVESAEPQDGSVAAPQEGGRPAGGAGAAGHSGSGPGATAPSTGRDPGSGNASTGSPGGGGSGSGNKGGSGGAGNGGDADDPGEGDLLEDTTDSVGTVIDDVVGSLRGRTQSDDGSGSGGLLD